MAMICVDVLIPHYNDFEGLLRSLKSVSQQTWHGKFRLIVCDDGSTQETLQLVRSHIATRTDGIILLENKINLGRPATRNILLKSIQSEYVAWLDAGDEWYPSKIEEQFQAVYRAKFKYAGKLTWVTCNYDWQWIGKKKRLRKQNVEGDQTQKLMIGQELRSYLWTLLGTADSFKCLGEFDEQLPRLQDLDYFIRFVAKGGRIISPPTERSLCVYHKSDIGRNAVEIHRCYSRIYHKHQYLYKKYSGKFNRMRRYEIKRHAARFAESNGDLFKKMYYIAGAFLIKPLYFIWQIYKNKGLKL